MILSIFLVVLAYLMGSICSAVIVCKACSLPDPRLKGSKNPGATNVLRLAGKKYALLVLLVDFFKGLIPLIIAKLFGAGQITLGFTVLAAVLGHMYPIFFKFKGGKGVATALGALLGLNFILGTVVIATWLLVARFYSYSSLASLLSIGLSPLYSLLFLQNPETFIPLFILVILITYKHRSNITRLMDGEEPKINIKPNLIKDLTEILEKEPPDEISPIKPSPEITHEEKPLVKTKRSRETKTTGKVTTQKAITPANRVKKAKTAASTKTKSVAAKTKSKKLKEE